MVIGNMDNSIECMAHYPETTLTFAIILFVCDLCLRNSQLTT